VVQAAEALVTVWVSVVLVWASVWGSVMVWASVMVMVPFR
jgi:hypothetical protein